MKLFIVVSALVVVALADPVQDRWDHVHQSCQKDPAVFVPDIIFEQLKNGENPTLPPNFGLHANCMLTKLDLQDEDGHIKKESVKHAVEKHIHDHHKVEEIVSECSVDKESKEKTALHMFKCFGKHKINIGQL